VVGYQEERSLELLHILDCYNNTSVLFWQVSTALHLGQLLMFHICWCSSCATFL